MEIGLLYSRIRRDEKLLLSELRDRGHDVQKIDVRDTTFAVGATSAAVDDLDIVFDRSLATILPPFATRFHASHGLSVVHSPDTAVVCADKPLNSLSLTAADVPTTAT